MDIIQNKKILILGLGNYKDGSGISAALFCLKHGAKKVIITDLKPAPALSDTISQLKKYKKRTQFVLGRHRLQDIYTTDLIIKNPGIPENSAVVKLAKRLKKPITNDIGLFLLFKPQGPVVGITGTRGKSTTTTLIYNFLKQKNKRTWLGGNIGVSPLKFIDQMKKGDITVLELSSWMLHDLKPQLTVAVITNILPDHLNRYANMRAYQKDKERIWQFQRSDQTVVLNAKDRKTRAMAKSAPAPVVWFATGAISRQGVGVSHQQITFNGQTVTSLSHIRLLGKHNLANVAAAIAVAKILRVSNHVIQKVLKSFTGIPNRLEFISNHQGICYYNDTTATTPDAAVAALRSFSHKIILIAGGNTKGLSLQLFAKNISHKVKFLVLLKGNAKASLKKALPSKRWCEVGDIPRAVAQAQKQAKRGDIVLLSPGCTWLPHMNEFVRGQKFMEEVKKLAK